MSAYKVVFWDVYGTLITSERGDLDSLLRWHDQLLVTFDQTVRNFALPMSGETLHEHFLAEIKTERDRRIADGVAHPEVRIEEIWLKLLGDTTLNRAREIALFFERHANPKKLMPQAFETLAELKRRGVRQGIISNAQFYTLIELSELLRDESAGAIRTYESIFDPKLVFLSCDFGVAKPDPALFQFAAETLAREGILPASRLFVGNSQEHDIQPAGAAGFRAVRFGMNGDITDLLDVLECL